MSYPKQLLRLAPARGITRDIPDAEAPLEYYTDGRNVEFPMGFAQRIVGHKSVYETLSAAPLAIAYTRLGGVGHWVYVSADEQHVADGSSHHDISLVAGLTNIPAAHFHQLFLLNGLPIHNNSFDVPMWWDGSTGNPFEELPNWPAGSVARFMCAHRNFLFALDLTTSAGARHNTVMWSDAAEPGSVPTSWTAGGGSLAGSVELADSDAPLICAAPLNDALMIYKRGATYSAHFVDDLDVVFAFRPVSRSLGALGRRAVAHVPGGHGLVTDGDVVLFDGVNAPSLIHGALRNELFDSLDPDRYEDLIAFYHRARQQLWVIVPAIGSATLAYVLDMPRRAWSVRELPTVAAVALGIVDDGAASDVFDDQNMTFDEAVRVYDSSALSLARESLVLAAPDESELLEIDGDASNADSSVARGGLTFGDATRVKFVRRVHVRMKPGSGPVSLRVGSRMRIGDSPLWTSPRTIVGNQIVNVRAQGRYIDVEVSATGLEPWAVTGIDIEAEMRGYH